MSWIKKGGKRINLNKIAEYQPVDETDIIFHTLSESGRLSSFDNISFESQEKRDKALDQIDRAVSTKNITGESDKGGATKISL